MRNIIDIYNEYKIMPNLQLHMLRVAAVASIICDNFDDEIPKEDIVTACLFHDMGNIIKFKLDYFPEFLEPEGIEYWQKVKDEYIEKYGADEHEATNVIMKELGLAQNIISITRGGRFALLCEHIKSSDAKIKIAQYSDYRVGPHGVISFSERMCESQPRYETKDESREQQRQVLVKCGEQMEEQIFTQCKIKPGDITDESVAHVIAELRNFILI